MAGPGAAAEVLGDRGHRGTGHAQTPSGLRGALPDGEGGGGWPRRRRRDPRRRASVCQIDYDEGTTHPRPGRTRVPDPDPEGGMMRPLILLALAMSACGTAVAEAPTRPAERRYAPPRIEIPTTTTTFPSEPEPEDAMVPLMEGARCPQWHATALATGWAHDDLPNLDHILWRESRCLPHVHYAGDPNGGSHGLTQINGYWCRPNRWSTAGWLQDRAILDTCQDLYDPVVNLTAARRVWEYAAERGCGWRPWSTRSTRWCG